MSLRDRLQPEVSFDGIGQRVSDIARKTVKVILLCDIEERGILDAYL